MEYESKEANELRNRSFEFAWMIAELERNPNFGYEETKRRQTMLTIKSILLAAAAWGVENWKTMKCSDKNCNLSAAYHSIRTPRFCSFPGCLREGYVPSILDPDGEGSETD